MPSYTVYAAPETLTGAQRACLAEAIAGVHSAQTGAPRSFVQTLFLPVAPGMHFTGAEPAHPQSIWVYGHIRRGRPDGTRTAICAGIADAVQTATAVPRQCIWVYLNELAHTDMIEFGSVLPAPGAEAAWIDAMNPDVRDYLRSLG